MNRKACQPVRGSTSDFYSSVLKNCVWGKTKPRKGTRSVCFGGLKLGKQNEPGIHQFAQTQQTWWSCIRTVELGDEIHSPPFSGGQYKHFIPQTIGSSFQCDQGKWGMEMFLTQLGLNISNILNHDYILKENAQKPNRNFWDLFHLKVILMLLNSQICYFLLPNPNYLKHTLQTYKYLFSPHVSAHLSWFWKWGE